MTKLKDAPIPAKLTGWNDMVETVKGLPAGIAAAFSTGRYELLEGYKPKEMTPAGEVKPLVDLIRVLVQTNQELQRHSKEVAQMAMDMRSGLILTQKKIEQIYAFANFQASDENDESEGAGE